jgi:hypothetical protein
MLQIEIPPRAVATVHADEESVTHTASQAPNTTRIEGSYSGNYDSNAAAAKPGTQMVLASASKSASQTLQSREIEGPFEEERRGEYFAHVVGVPQTQSSQRSNAYTDGRWKNHKSTKMGGGRGEKLQNKY